MSELMLPIVITAVADPEAEGFIASTLFAQGWSVVFRAIDWDCLERYVNENPERAKSALLIYASDLTGISKLRVHAIVAKFRQIIGFATNSNSNPEFADLSQMPAAAGDLVSLVRGFVRAPMLRTSAQLPSQLRKAKVLAVGSAGSYTGCTLISINLAMELSNLGKSTLLIEANFRSPSISAMLAMRNIGADSSWKTIAPQLSLYEITQEQAGDIDALMTRAGNEFDYVIVDIGSISGLSNRLTDRRWTSTMTTWCCDQADELLVVARSDYLGLLRLNHVIELLLQTSVRAELSFVLNMKSPGKRGDVEQSRFLAATTPLKPLRVRTIAKDARAIVAAEDERATLIETNERSAVRKSIAELACEI